MILFPDAVMCDGAGVELGEQRELAVRAELNRLLESPAFRTSKRCREFLRYIVEHTLSRSSAALKERSIGVDLFQLPPDFDTGQHTVVRVTANEVRKKLAQQYLNENGSHHGVRIELPPGSYCAEFNWDAPTPETRVRVRRMWFTRPVIACAAVALVISGAALGWYWRGAEYPGHRTSLPATSAAPKPSPGGGPLRMRVGSVDTYVDRSGKAWGPDRFFTGGAVVSRPSEKIRRTLDPDIYRHSRTGDFRYAIPLQAGSYELHLHFAETGLSDLISAESSGEGQRVFSVLANGKPILDYFDVVSDADGSNIADERVFRDVSPAEDGFLHLSFASVRSTPILSAIEALPMSARTVKPVRIRAGWTGAWEDSAGQQWRPDSYFLGGNALVRPTNPVRESDLPTPDLALYTSERWGHFSYAVPMPEGQYRLTLKFCEGHYGPHNTGVGGVGSRIFDVYCNGVALLRTFDIFKEAGGEGRPLERSFSGIRPNAQGKIVLSFVPVTGMACVNGIEVVDESR